MRSQVPSRWVSTNSLPAAAGGGGSGPLTGNSALEAQTSGRKTWMGAITPALPAWSVEVVRVSPSRYKALESRCASVRVFLLHLGYPTLERPEIARNIYPAWGSLS